MKYKCTSPRFNNFTENSQDEVILKKERYKY